MDALQLSADARSTAGVLLLAIVFIEYGGWFMLRVVRGRQAATPFQQAFFRAGHAHAGVLVTLSLVCLLVADAARITGPLASIGRSAVPLAAILMPAGFFLSAAGRGVSAPNRLILLLYVGAAWLAVGVASLGVAILTSQGTVTG
jgi:hypothetical protein